MSEQSTEEVIVPAKPFEEPQFGQELAVPDSKGIISAFSNASNFKAAQKMAMALMQATMVPKAYRESLPNTLIAMELASRIGASVFMVMQNLDVINGVPGWRAKFLIATVNTCGRFSALKFRWKGEEGKPGWECRAYATELKSGEECVGPKVTMEIAAAEGWSSKAGSKWKTIPELMMMYRSGAFWTRVYAPELSLGILTEDEVADILPDAKPPMIAPGTPITEVVGSAATKFLEKIRPEPETKTASSETKPESGEAKTADPQPQEPTGETPTPKTEPARRGAPSKCKMQFCKESLKTEIEREAGFCDAQGHRTYMIDQQRKANGTAPPPRGQIDPNEADKTALAQLIGRLKHKLMLEEEGDIEAVSARLKSITEGRCDSFDDLPAFLRDFPKYIPNVTKAADGK